MAAGLATHLHAMKDEIPLVEWKSMIEELKYREWFVAEVILNDNDLG